MKMYIAGKWVDKAETIDVTNPYDGSVIDTVPRGSTADVEQAIASAERGAKAMAALSAYQRYEIIHRAADIMLERLDDLGRTITLEEGKVLAEGLGEAARAQETIVLSAEEAKRLTGETLDLSGASAGAGKFGFTLRVPCGVVAAITPFNFPLNLVCHKVGPALAAGNAIVIKPASDTPLSALKLTEIFLDAGIPEEAIQCVTGSGGVIGDAISSNPKVRKISFTGSSLVGEQITQNAGVKRLSLELGSNAACVIMADADIEKVAPLVATGGLVNAGQVCISTQRVLVEHRIYNDFLDALKTPVEDFKLGDPFAEDSMIGAMISETEASRVGQWIDEAVGAGARIVTGGERDAAQFSPTVIADVKAEMRVCREELFGPALAVAPFDSVDDAIALTNDSAYGLGAGIFTENINTAMRFAQAVETGNVMINWTPLWRADLMPYGGFKRSGIGKEGPRDAVREMTEIKTVVLHGLGQ